MPVGLQTWNESGVLMLDLTHRLGRVYDTWSTGTTNGSRVVPGLADGGEPFVFVEDNSADLSNATPYALPNVTISGTTVSWSFVDFDYPSAGNTVARRAVNLQAGTF